MLPNEEIMTVLRLPDEASAARCFGTLLEKEWRGPHEPRCQLLFDALAGSRSASKNFPRLNPRLNRNFSLGWMGGGGRSICLSDS
jgi:hypothetical protein